MFYIVNGSNLNELTFTVQLRHRPPLPDLRVGQQKLHQIIEDEGEASLQHPARPVSPATLIPRVSIDSLQQHNLHD